MGNNTSKLLFVAGIYNLIWGAWVVLFPASLFTFSEIEIPNYLMIWQSVGLVVGVYGLGYIAASKDYVRHWPIVLVGFLGKLGGPIGICYHVFMNGFPKVFLWITLFNDVIWLVPFYWMLKKVYDKGELKF